MAEGKAKATVKKAASKSVAKGTKAAKVSAKSAKSSKAAAKPSAKAKVAKAAGELSAAQLIDQRIEQLGGWQGETLARMRELILKADSEIIEEWKWSVPVWSCNGIICTGESYKKAVKLTFAKGASIADPKKLFNSSLEGNTRRAIDIGEGDKVDATAFKALIKAAVAVNGTSGKKATAASVAKAPAKKAKPKMSGLKPSKDKYGNDVILLSGDNPQIAKDDGDTPVQAYIAAIPGWKQGLAERLDKMIVKAVPGVKKAVKWNSPFYGVEGQGWFVNFHCFGKYIKVAFFKGTSLVPMPPKESKSPGVRYWDIYEKDVVDEAQFTSWVKQAAAIPGWMT